MTRSLSSVAREVSGRLIGADATFADVTTDTRQLGAGALFVALAGPRFDGNEFLADALARGAVGALVSRPAALPLPQVQVSDTRTAFGRMAQAWRENFEIPVIAVTGSAGKTTVKELIASIVGMQARVCVTEGNLNNDIGVPLTLMRLSPEDEALVIELGANHAGEIDYLAALVEPNVAVITNAGAAHLEGFGSVAGVAAAKGELLDHLPRAGTAVLNADDAFFPDWRARARCEYVLGFGTGPAADCRLTGEPRFAGSTTHFELRLPDAGELAVELPLIGQANVMNALAAAAAAHAVGCSAEHIREGLERAHVVKGRLTALTGRAGSTVIDDSYNANPTAARAALDYLATLPGTRIFVLGDMAELGPEAPRLHAEIGKYARARCDALLAVGGLAAEAAQAFGENGRSFADIDRLAAELGTRLGDDVTVLIKGSRFMGLERLVASLVVDGSAGAKPC